MKKMIFGLMALCCMVSLHAEKRVTAELKDATVFLSGAELTHTVSFPVEAGNQEVVIDGLSGTLQENSLQISLTNGMVITSYTFDREPIYRKEDSTKLAELERLCKQKEDTFKLVIAELKSLNKAIDLLGEGIQRSMENNKSLTDAGITSLLNYYQKEQTKLQKQILAAENDKVRLADEVKIINKQILEETKPNTTVTGLVRLKINSPAKKKATVQIKYFTWGAKWNMTYDMRVEANGKPLSLTQTAEVSQTTGMDWMNVHLTLSTLIPNKNNKLPQLKPWRLYEDYPVYGYSAKRYATAVVGKAMMTEDAVFEEAEADLEMGTMSNYTTQNEQQLALEYNISIPYTIAADGKAEVIALEEKNIANAEYHYAAVPSQDAAAFFIAEVSNWSSLNLLDGKARITYDGTFYGETYISQPENDKLQLTLGTDKQIVIRREQTNNTRKTVGSNTVITRTYTITVRNNKTMPIVLDLQEPYPVAGSDKIKVELNKDNTPTTINDTNKGILTYTLNLQPNEEKTITVSYTVKYPKDLYINL